MTNAPRYPTEEQRKEKSSRRPPPPPPKIGVYKGVYSILDSNCESFEREIPPPPDPPPKRIINEDRQLFAEDGGWFSKPIRDFLNNLINGRLPCQKKK